MSKSPVPEIDTGNGLFVEIVPRTGFEPVIPALKGRCPRPLDERGAYSTILVLLYGFYSIAIPLSSEIALILLVFPLSITLSIVTSEDRGKFDQIIKWIATEKARTIDNWCGLANCIASRDQPGAILLQICDLKTKMVLR